MNNKLIQYILRIIDEASKPLDDVGDKAEEVEESLDKASDSSKSFGENLLGLGGYAAGAATAFVGLAQKLADSRNEIADWSTRTGVASGTLAGLRLAAEGSGLSFEGLAEPLLALSRNTAQAAAGNEDLQRKFAALGVSATDAEGGLRMSEDVLRDLLGSIAAIESPAERAAAATALLGEQGTRFLQALGDPRALDHFVEQAELFGADHGPKAAAAAAQWQRSMAGLQTSLAGTADTLFQAFGGEGAASLLDDMALGFKFMGDIGAAAIKGIMEAWQPLVDAIGQAASGEFMAAASSLREWAGSATGLNVVDNIFGSGQAWNRAISDLEAGRALLAETRRLAETPVQGGGGGSFIASLTAPDTAAAAEAIEAAPDFSQEWATFFDDYLRQLGDVESEISDAMAGLTRDGRDMIDKLTLGAELGATGLSATVDPLGALSSGMAGPQAAAIASALSALEAIGREGVDAIVERLTLQAEAIIDGVMMLPELFDRLITELPHSIGQAIAEALREATSAKGIKERLNPERLLNSFTMGGYGLVKGLFGMPKVGEGFYTGDIRPVNRTGLHMLHQDERVIRASGGSSATTARMAMGAGGGNGGPPVVIYAGAVSPDVYGAMADGVQEQFNASGWGRGTRVAFGGG